MSEYPIEIDKFGKPKKISPRYRYVRKFKKLLHADWSRTFLPILVSLWENGKSFRALTSLPQEIKFCANLAHFGIHVKWRVGHFPFLTSFSSFNFKGDYITFFSPVKHFSCTSCLKIPGLCTTCDAETAEDF